MGKRVSQRRFFLGAGVASAVLVSLSAQPPTQPTLKTLDRVAQIRALSPTEAAKSFPVRVRGVVTYHDALLHDVFVEDRSGGIYVVSDKPWSVQQGQQIEVVGISDPGEFAPVIEKAQIRILGPGVLPKPVRLMLEDVSTGQYDSAWVEVNGVVLSAILDNRRVRLDLGDGADHVTVVIPDYEGAPLSGLVGAHVTVHGVAGSTFTKRRQLTGVAIHAQNISDIIISKAASARALAPPITRAHDLLLFSPGKNVSERIRVRGVVTFQQPGQFVFIRDGDQGLKINTRQRTPFEAGDKVEATGFAEQGGYNPILRYATLRLLEHGTPPKSLALTSVEILSGNHDADLVQIKADLMVSSTTPPTDWLTLKSDGQAFEAELERPAGPETALPVRPGSQLRLTGICLIQVGGDFKEPKSFRLLLRSTKDIVVLRRPSWWTLSRALWLLAFLGTGAISTLTWATLLRKRVQAQTAELARKNQALRESEEQYRVLFERNPCPMWVFDPDTLSFLAVNHAAVHQYGYSREEFLAMTLKDIRAPEEVPRLLQSQAKKWVENQIEPFRAGVWRHRQKDGTLIDVEITRNSTHFGNQPAELALANDITERKRAEQTKALLASIVDSCDEAIIGKTLDGIIVSWNAGAERIYGYSPDEAIGKCIFILATSEHLREMAQILDKVRRGKKISLETVRVRRDGSPIDVSLSISPICNGDGEIVGISTIARDISVQKRAEEELKRAKDAAETADRLKGEFLANMSHEIRTPMNAVLGMTALALDTEDREEQKEYLHDVLSSAESLLALLNDILDLSKIDAGRMELDPTAFSLGDLMRETVHFLGTAARIKGLALNCEVGSDIPDQLIGDPLRLREVLVNLMGNGIKFTEKGSVNVKAEVQSEESDEVFIQFSVDDTGPGVPEDKQQLIFEPFCQADGSTTRKYGGTGLGLTISSGLVALMGGRIWVDNKPGEGSTFCFTARFGRVLTSLNSRQETNLQKDGHSTARQPCIIQRKSA